MPSAASWPLWRTSTLRWPPGPDCCWTPLRGRPCRSPEMILDFIRPQWCLIIPVQYTFLFYATKISTQTFSSSHPLSYISTLYWVNTGSYTHTDTWFVYIYVQLNGTCVSCVLFVIQGLCLCLDFQFDTVVRDRPIILSKLLLLHFLKKDIPALSWEFFVNRFETLSLEAQLHLDCNKEFPFPTSRLQLRSLQKFPHLPAIVPQAFSITLGSLCVFFFPLDSHHGSTN